MNVKSLFILFVLIVNQIFAQSPFGYGKITNQDIGQLEDESVITSSQSGYGFFDFFPSAQSLLKSYKYDIYVPDDYDETEPYGLITFINSGNDGGFKSQWLSVLDDKKLIWIAGDGIGNSIDIKIRMGVAMSAALRMLELYNIDTNRVYSSGNSGGARMAQNLAFIYPETFKGALPSCGGSYISNVEQDYETQNPDSHYEAILNYPSNYLDYLKPFDQRYANLTSYNDFREGDIMNIYHNGYEKDGLKGKFLETTGNHCSTTTEHFLDALNFVEHPYFEIIKESFDGSTVIPFVFNNASLANSSNLQMGHNFYNTAQIKSKNLFQWNDPKGAIFETSIQLNQNDFNQNTLFHLGFWSMKEPLNYCGFIGNQLKEKMPGILLSIDFTEDQPTLVLKIKNSNQPDKEILFSSTFSDWNVYKPLKIKYHLWNEELRIELGVHLTSPISTEQGVRLLDDMRSIRIRWNDITPGFWSQNDWVNGGFITLLSEKKDVSESSSNLLINYVNLFTAETDILIETPKTYNFVEATICIGESYEFNNRDLNTSGIYYDTLVNLMGCDSIVSLDLMINPLPIVNISDNYDDFSTDMTFKSYQWYFNDTLMQGEIESTLKPKKEGNYYVEVTDENGCKNTSNILTFIINDVSDLEDYGIKIYPNPTTRYLFIESKSLISNIELFDMSGKKLMKNLKSINDLSALENELHFLKIKLDKDILIVKIQKID